MGSKTLLASSSSYTTPPPPPATLVEVLPTSFSSLKVTRISPVSTSTSRASSLPEKVTLFTSTLPATEPARPLPVTLPTSAPTPQPVLVSFTLQAKRVILPVSTYLAPSSLPAFWTEAGSTSSDCWKASSERISCSLDRSTRRSLPR